MGVKKAICNEKAAMIAEHGDSAVCGGLRAAIAVVKRLNPQLRAWYEKREIPISEEYMHDRRAAAQKAEEALDALNAELLEKIARDEELEKQRAVP